MNDQNCFIRVLKSTFLYCLKNCKIKKTLFVKCQKWLCFFFSKDMLSVIYMDYKTGDIKTTDTVNKQIIHYATDKSDSYKFDYVVLYVFNLRKM